MHDAEERLSRTASTLRQLCNHGKIRATKGEDGHWRISADEMARLEQEGVPKLPQRPSGAPSSLGTKQAAEHRPSQRQNQ
jgi:hypothetical protein